MNLDTRMMLDLCQGDTRQRRAYCRVFPPLAPAGVGQAHAQVARQVDPLAEQRVLGPVLLETVGQDGVEIVQTATVKCPECVLFSPPLGHVSFHLQNTMNSRLSRDIGIWQLEPIKLRQP